MESQTVEDENVSLRAEINRLREWDAATREILSAISKSRDDKQPVLDAITRNAVKLCNAAGAGLWLLNTAGDVTRLASTAQEENSRDPAVVSVGLEFPREDTSLMGQCYRDSRPMHVADNLNDPYYKDGDPTAKKLVKKVGMRSRLIVPLLQDGIAFGCISLHRKEVRAFSVEEVNLIESFAEQAVIAIENARQFREVQERHAHEGATKEILEVISQSRDDAQPVFQAILENACRLCDTPLALLADVDDSTQTVGYAAHNGARVEFVDFLQKIRLPLSDERHALVQAVVHNKVVQVTDARDSDLYREGNSGRTIPVDVEGVTTFLVVPLSKNGRGFGAVVLYRREVRPYSEKDISIIRGFASQAVIAIENVRQFKALESFNAELSNQVDEQVDQLERMGRLKRFLPAAVADTVVSRGADKMLSSHRALLGVLFCDIRGFTAFCEIAEPEETIEVLQTYHKEMGKLINVHGAGVDHRMGDGIMVLFNDPLPCDDPAGDAVRLALAMHDRMAELSKQWKRMGYRLGFGVGVSLGYATVGMVGFEGRFDYTASGTAINLASRLCDEAEDGEILLSPKATIAIEDSFPVASRGELSLKGLREPLEIFRLTRGEAM